MARRRKLTPQQCVEIVWYYGNTDMSMERIGKRYNVSAAVVGRVLDGKYKPRIDDVSSAGAQERTG